MRFIRLAGHFLRLSPARMRPLTEACLLLVLARLLLALLPFRMLARVMNYPLASTALTGARRAFIRNEIAWAVKTAADRLPGRTVCFPRAIAAQIMCRSRGIDAMIFYGAAVEQGQALTAHVWVQDGREGVVGFEDVGRFSVLARFPA
jgi:uncharacterized membrane protein YjgN (DUF898 family)